MTLSVIIPTYNGSRFIEQTILSVLNQERPADEILVCDDNSTDDTLAICRRYADRIRIWKNPAGPSGFVNSWNAAVARTKGDLISILHQDDRLAPSFIRLGLGALEAAPDVRHFFSTCRYIDEEGQALSLSLEDCSGRILRLSGQEYFQAYQRRGHPHIHRCPGVITHRSIFDQCRYEPAAGHIADDDFFYRVGRYTDVIGVLSPLASFRIHVGSVTGRMKDTELVRSLMEDYIYQCRQWKGDPFLDKVSYDYFVRHARKYIRRYIGYGIRQREAGLVARGIREWVRLAKILHRC